ncbi:hypothetical protein TNCV_3714861 [Trichonephila clavipes]|nr:hypothetical protein TNCV_3714861 [Trichonephila clavipes]
MRRKTDMNVMHTVTDSKMLCLETYRTLQIIAAFEIHRKIFLFVSLKRKPGCEPGPLVLQSNVLPLNYTHATANLCFAFRRNGYENAQKIFLFTSLKMRAPGFKPRTSLSAVECSTTELYPTCQRTFALRLFVTSLLEWRDRPSPTELL